MCTPPSIPKATQTEQKDIAAPTYADAAQRQKQTRLAGRDIKTSARGLSDSASTSKKSLLGD